MGSSTSSAVPMDLILFLNKRHGAPLGPRLLPDRMAMQAMSDEKCGIVGMRLLYPDDGSVQHGG